MLLQLLAAVGDVVAELRKIRQVLEHRAHPRDVHDRRVLAALVAVVGELRATFSTGEVVRHARLDQALAAALMQADADTPRALGHLFRRLEGRTMDGWALERCGEDRDGLVWRVLRV